MAVIKAVIFDCYGVLAEDGWLPFKRKYIGDDFELSRQLADLGKQNEYGMLGNSAYFKKVAELIGVEENIFKTAIGRQVPNEELFDYIKTSLKGNYKIGLLSNANYDVVNELFTPDQASLFDASVLSYESRLIKPDTRMFDLICSRLGVTPEECIFIDDIERYCTAAELLGMHSIHYQNPGQCQREIESLIA